MAAKLIVVVMLVRFSLVFHKHGFAGAFFTICLEVFDFSGISSVSYSNFRI